MADVELVVKIPEALYNNIQNGCWIYPYTLVYEALKNGTPLPKGMIDANKVQEGIKKLLKEPGYQHEGEDWKNGLIMAEDLIYDALTIIKADNEERQDEKT